VLLVNSIFKTIISGVVHGIFMRVYCKFTAESISGEILRNGLSLVKIWTKVSADVFLTHILTVFNTNGK